MIDEVPTLIYSVHGTYAKGAIVQDDCTLQDTYIAKAGNYFAHGKTLHKAREDAFNKYTQDMSKEERIEAFLKAHPDKEAKYTYDDLFRWHNILTGSCEQGRLQFCKERNITPQDKFTVKEFCNLTENAYGGSIIRKLKESL